MADPLLELRKAGAQRGRFELAPLDLSLGRGEVLAVLGPSGCGKSTLLDMICGLGPGRLGRVFMEGRDVTELPPHKRDAALSLQEVGLWDRLSARRNVGLASRKGRADDWLDMVEFTADRDAPTATLSGGERQRVALARTLSRNAALTLLDEPGSNLDRLSNLRLGEIVANEVRNRNGALVVVAHRLDAVLRHEPTRLLILESGQAVREGNAEEVMRDPKTLYVASLLGYEIILPARTGLDRPARRPVQTEGPSVEPSPALHAWRFGGIRESATGPITAKVIRCLSTETGEAVRVEIEGGERFLIPRTANTQVGTEVRLVADDPVVVHP